MLLRRYHEKKSEEFIEKIEIESVRVTEPADIEELINEEIPFIDIPENDELEAEILDDEIEDLIKEEKINLEPVVEPIESEVDLEELTVSQLNEIALERGIEVPKKIKKDDLIKLIREG